MKRLEAAIVGAGLMGGWHARYAERAGGRIVGIVDPREEAAAALARRFPRARTFATLAECLRACAAEVVHVCTGADSHVALALAALEAGRHALVEKPAASAGREARRLADLARQRGRTLCPVHQLPFQRGFQALLRQRGRLATIVRIAVTIASAGGEGRGEAERRDVLLEILPHGFSLLRALLGPQAALCLRTLAFTDDGLELAGRCGGVALSLVVGLRGRPPLSELVVMGTEATALVDLFHGYCVLDRGPTSRTGKALRPFRRGVRLLAGAGSNLLVRAAAGEPAFPGLRELIAAFYRTVRGGGPPPVSLEELVETADLLEAVSSAPPYFS